jgi:tetratricopeptide (TPR) repeat protein
LYSQAYFNRGIAKSNLQDYRGAIADYNKAIEIDPLDSKAYFNLGFSKYKINDLNGACLDWSKAGELGYYEAYDTIKKVCN